jgi:alpha-1,2-mannosyltransferase
MPSLAATFRDAAWISDERVRAWRRVLAAFCVISLLAAFAVSRFGSGPDPWQRPLGPDFVNVWTAGRMSLQGQAGLAWDPAVHEAVESRYFPPADGFREIHYPFFYPPPLLLLILPFALLPYAVALLAWIVITNLACFMAIQKLLPWGWSGVVSFLAFPAVLLNAAHGQNGALTAALIATAAITADRRPAIAGICLGTLCIKPQLVLLLAPLLLAGRRWRIIAWSALTVGALCLASIIAFGVSSWAAFVAAMPGASAVMELGLVAFGKMVSSFAALRLVGSNLTIAWAGQTIMTIVAGGLAVHAAWRHPGGRAEIALFASSALLATPYLFDYDLMVLAVPMAWVVSQSDRTSFLPWEKSVLATAFLLPLFARLLALGTGLSVAPVILMAVFLVVLRRAHRVCLPEA